MVTSGGYYDVFFDNLKKSLIDCFVECSTDADFSKHDIDIIEYHFKKFCGAVDGSKLGKFNSLQLSLSHEYAKFVCGVDDNIGDIIDTDIIDLRISYIEIIKDKLKVYY